MPTRTRPDRLHFTGDDTADRLLASDPLALLIGFVLDQQVPLQRAFAAPLELRRRIGLLDAGHIARTDPAAIERAFRQRPALHRFPGTMAQRTQALCALIVDEYGGEAARVWEEAEDADDLRRRLESLPGFGQMKVKALAAVLAKRFGVGVAEPLAPDHPTLGDVDSPAALDEYQAKKGAYKSARRQSA